jgi:hypothetical protein
MTADDVEAIQRLIVTHERRVVDDSVWDDYLVTLDRRTFRLNLGARDRRRHRRVGRLAATGSAR